jgi:hypothetical protein
MADVGKRAKFNQLGQLETAPGEFDLPKFNSLAVNDQAYNYYTPIPSYQFIITGILAFATKDVADNTDTSIIIYEATTPSTATASKVILQFGMGQLTVLPMPGIRLLVSEGVYINAKVDDATVDLNLFGHFVPTIQKTVGNAIGVA